MKYSDIIALQPYFHPVFNLQNEATGYWKQFIPTIQFYDLLGKTIDAVSSNQSSNRKSIWVKGTFGTGKSHAGAVIKHLLCNNVSEISDYVEDRILRTDLKSRLMRFRDNKRLFPVVLKGTEGGKVYDMRSFLLNLERFVKDSLRNSGYSITVQSDFERAIEYLESTPIDINGIIANEPELRSYAKTKEDIIKKLHSSDTDVYLALENALAKPQYSVHFSSSDIVKWLSGVEQEIVNKNIADGLLIIWDEFTSVMDTISSGMTNMIQNIAELTESQNVYLYLISHRNSNAYNSNDVTRMEDRFHIMQYNMEALTTYRIMAASVRKLDETQYSLYRSDRMDKHSELITYLTENDSQQSIKDIKDLFPFHPYSAFLCSTIANQIGSANRTVMQFMYAQSGFLGFLNDENTCENKLLLTSDKLWDYFLEEFQKDSEKYGIINQTFYTRKKVVEDKGKIFEKVFKGILLLNAMRNKIGDSDKIIPSIKNIKYLFEGEDFEVSIDEILDYFHKNQIIQRDPSDNFLIAISTLPVNEINEAVNRVKSSFSDTKKILEYDPQIKSTINKIFENSLIRQSSLAYLACSSDAYLVRSYMKSAFKEPYALNIALFFAMDTTERQTMTEIVKDFSIMDDFNNVVFLMFDEIFDYDGMQKNSFYEYMATAQVAKSRNVTQITKTNDDNAKKVIINWITRLKQGTAKIYFRGIESPINANNFTKYINDNIVQQIFNNGVETLLSLRKSPMSFWEPFKNPSKASIEPMLVAANRNEAEQKFRAQYTPAKLLFKDDNDDYVVDSDLVLKSNARDNHPLVQIQRKVDEILENTKRNINSTFSLGAVLQPLTQPPFGLYTNIPNMAVLAFSLRKYVNELNGVELGTPIDSNNMRDKVLDIFNYWQKGSNDNRLRVRFGSKEEKDLKDLLIGIFDMKRLSDVPELTSLKNVRWGIVGYCKQKSELPLWCLKYSSLVATDDFISLIDQLVDLIQKEELKDDSVKKILKALDLQKFELPRALLNNSAFEEGFKTFIRNIESVSIEDNWWDELKEHLNQKLQSEIGFWKESDVESKVKDFYILKTRKPETKPIDDPQPIPELPSQPSQPLAHVQKINRIKEKIAKASNFSPIVLKNALLQVLEIFPETADIIDENLES